MVSERPLYKIQPNLLAYVNLHRFICLNIPLHVT
nr:MAG TPA: hypothetical protein [Caudoviricetes sp.]